MLELQTGCEILKDTLFLFALPLDAKSSNWRCYNSSHGLKTYGKEKAGEESI